LSMQYFETESSSFDISVKAGESRLRAPGQMTICEHRPLSLWKLQMINNIRTCYRDFRAPLSTQGPRYFAPSAPPSRQPWSV
jgi:hypothetical protein